MITRKGRSGHKTILREKLAIGDPEKKSTEQTWVVKGCKNHRPTLKKILWIGPRGLKSYSKVLQNNFIVRHFISKNDCNLLGKLRKAQKRGLIPAPVGGS